MKEKLIRILLADDDNEDRNYFGEALGELTIPTTLTTVNDGVQLMELLSTSAPESFDVLFLDLNMPRKNGFASLEEIKNDDRIKDLPVIIVSTSYDERSADVLYRNKAQFYICKPTEFETLKQTLSKVLKLILNKKNVSQPSRENFLLKLI